MTQHIFRSISEPIREKLSWIEIWRGQDDGLIHCWELGRKKRMSQPDLAVRAEAGELVPLGWKGGVQKKLEVEVKLGTLNYLAEWQGLRGENLNIDVGLDSVIVCSKTGQRVRFTHKIITDEE
jgi:hypothetical protein